MDKTKSARMAYDKKLSFFKQTQTELESQRWKIKYELDRLLKDKPLVCIQCVLGDVAEKEQNEHLEKIVALEKQLDITESALKGLDALLEKELPQELNEVEALEQAYERYPELKEAVLQGREAKAEHERLLKQYGKQQADNILQKDIALIRNLTDNISQLKVISKQLNMTEDCEAFLKGLEVKHE